MGVEGKPESMDYLALTCGPIVLAREARLGEVGTAVPAASEATLCAATCDLPCALCVDVTLEGEKIRMIDYASAGKTLDAESLTEAWLKTK